jgi:hypothetical protein
LSGSSHEPVAQPVEHLTFNQGVAGSNPAGLTIGCHGSAMKDKGAMKTRLVLIAVIAACALFGGAFPESPLSPIAPALAACDPGTHIDKTTVEQIRDKLIKAGYKNPLHLRKGCDNAWHGTAIRNGQQINVAVTPDGHIVQEGD